MIARFLARPLANVSWLVCAVSIPWPTCATPVSTAGSTKQPTSCRKSKNWRNRMILLRHDCLGFKTTDGEAIPCTAQQMTVELLGEAAHLVDEHVVKHAAEAVLHYFKTELGRTTVTTAEFSQALERVLRGLGFEVQSQASVNGSPPRVVDYDLRHLAFESGKGFELVFFSK